MRCAIRCLLACTLFILGYESLTSTASAENPITNVQRPSINSRGIRVTEQVLALPGRQGGGWNGLNNRGELLGTYDAYSRSFLWSRENGFKDLGDRSEVRREAINDCGEFAGTVFTPNGHRAMRMRGDEIEELGTLEPDNPNAWSEGFEINERGDVVGYASMGRGYSAFLWTEEEGMVAIEGPEANTVATDINNRRQIIGSRTIEATQVAVLWEKTSSGFTAKWTGTLGRAMSGTGVNASGEAIGDGITGYANPLFNSVYWSRATGQIELWPYGPNDQYAAGSGATDIDDRGRIAGAVNLKTGPDFFWQAAVWTSPYQFHVLTDQNSIAWGINNRGDVIGSIVLPDQAPWPLIVWNVQTPLNHSDWKAFIASVTARAICRSRGM